MKELAPLYELVIFTAGLQDYADWVLDQLDKEGLISYRLYRQHASPKGVFFVKDLARIGRDLARTIIIDNTAENFQRQVNNGIYIKSFYDDPQDTELEEMLPFLKCKICS